MIHQIDRYIRNNIIYKIVGKTTTTNLELDYAGNLIFGSSYKGTHPSDQIPYMTINQCCIINVDKSNEPGSHWLGIYNFKQGYLVYDSFGRSLKQLISIEENLYDNVIVDTDDDIEQMIAQTDCGARCLSFLLICREYGFDQAKKL